MTQIKNRIPTDPAPHITAVHGSINCTIVEEIDLVCSKEWQEEPGKESCQCQLSVSGELAQEYSLGVDVVWQGNAGGPGSDGASPYLSQVASAYELTAGAVVRFGGCRIRRGERRVR
jgi:hypothetical protein